ncbi:MAG: cytidylate kinase family protein, partial [Deltaproteobacteria bacterium]|nr:cytidylate kinase family protein [Deltaproteobacteria bacterium]
MAIITISRGSFSHGKEIAEKVAAKLGYECISREVLIEASEFFNVAEMKLTKSIHDAPSILERMTHG